MIQISGMSLDSVVWGMAQEVACLKSTPGESWEGKDSVFTLLLLSPF